VVTKACDISPELGIWDKEHCQVVPPLKKILCTVVPHVWSGARGITSEWLDKVSSGSLASASFHTQVVGVVP
jgi:hypothetical protein